MDSGGQQGYGFLHRILEEGGDQLSAKVTGETVIGWQGLTISAEAVRAGERCWLRATGERREWAYGDEWSGLKDADSLPAEVPRPRLLGRDAR